MKTLHFSKINNLSFEYIKTNELQLFSSLILSATLYSIFLNHTYSHKNAKFDIKSQMFRKENV